MYTELELPFKDVPQLSSKDVAYQSGDTKLRPFYAFPPEMKSFEKAALAREIHDMDRKALVEEILNQYHGEKLTPESLQNIEALRHKNVYTVITAHQPSLLTGPLYFIFKICSVISLSQKINAENFDFKVVPVFILGGEDHDFEEIASIHLFNKTFTWESQQKGAVGRMSVDDLRPVINEIMATFGSSPHGEELRKVIEEAITASNTYYKFMFRLVNVLFGEYGLITVSMDSPQFKNHFLNIIEKDIESEASYELVNRDQEEMDKAGFKRQALTREVNLFFHGEDRHRIINEDNGTYAVGAKKLTRKALLELLREQPENASPNVILRPLYQEYIFPNLAYVGGGGEIAYWLERKSLFEHYGVPFPILIRRDSFMIVDRRSCKTLDDLDLNVIELFEREEQIINKYALRQAETNIDLTKERNEVDKIYDGIAILAKKLDPSLFKYVKAEGAKVDKSLNHLESRLLKAVKSNQEIELRKISKLKHKFFPGNDSLQERYDNFIPFYLRHGPEWIKEIISHADPLNKNFKILLEA